MMEAVRRWLPGVAAVVLLVAGLLATPAAFAQQQAVVTMNDGRVFRGELVGQNTTTVTLKIANIDTPIQRADIASIDVEKPIEQEYAQRRAALQDGDLEGRYALAQWLYERQAFGLAQRELDDLAARFPDDARVSALQKVVAGRLKLAEQAQSATPAEPRQPEPAAPAPADETPAAEPLSTEVLAVDSPENKLTPEQINLIRLYEVDLSRRPPVVVPRDVIEDLLTNHAESKAVPRGRQEQAALRGAQGWRQLQVIFDAQARELYPRVQVRADPPAIQTFKTQIHQRYVLNYCASARCHGGDRGGDLFLFRTAPTSDPTVYSNFYILHRYSTPTAFMIDRRDPERSLLLQYAMSREVARTPHPEVPGYAPEIRTVNDPRIRQIQDWIRELYEPTPNYGIDYTPPTPGQPAGTPDAAPPPDANTEAPATGDADPNPTP